MTNPAHFSPKIACVALLCVGAILLAWAAPVMVISGDMPEFLKRSQDHQASDPAEALAETEDAFDDPVLLVSNGGTGLLPLTFALQAQQLTKGRWSPASPVRPPNNLTSI